MHDGKVGVQALQLDQSVAQGELGLDGQATQVTGQQRRDAQEARPKGEGRIERFADGHRLERIGENEQQRHGQRRPVAVAHRDRDQLGEQDVRNRRVEPAADQHHRDVEHAVGGGGQVAIREQARVTRQVPAQADVVGDGEEQDGVGRDQPLDGQTHHE